LALPIKIAVAGWRDQQCILRVLNFRAVHKSRADSVRWECCPEQSPRLIHRFWG